MKGDLHTKSGHTKRRRTVDNVDSALTKGNSFCPNEENTSGILPFEKDKFLAGRTDSEGSLPGTDRHTFSEPILPVFTHPVREHVRNQERSSPTAHKPDNTDLQQHPSQAQAQKVGESYRIVD